VIILGKKLTVKNHASKIKHLNYVQLAHNKPTPTGKVLVTQLFVADARLYISFGVQL
jgi:hypothetical protein